MQVGSWEGEIMGNHDRGGMIGDQGGWDVCRIGDEGSWGDGG
jgi:hypothetical protein